MIKLYNKNIYIFSNMAMDIRFTLTTTFEELLKYANQITNADN